MDDDAQVEDPHRIDGGVVAFARELLRRQGDLHLQAFAAGLAYGATFALVPALVLLVLLLGLFQAQDLVTRAMDQLQDVLPADAIALLDTQLHAAASTSSQGAFGLGAIASVAIALWGASGAMRRVMEALNVVHRAPESRGYVPKVAVSVALAVGAIVTVAVSVAVIVFGGDFAEQAFDVLGIGGAATAWSWIRWPLLVAIAWLAIAAAYRYAPASRVCGGFATPGTLVATAGWVGFSVAFSWYVGGIGSLDATWGAVAGVVVLLLYLQYVGLIVLWGALIDVLLWDRGIRPLSVRRLLERSRAAARG